MNLVIIGRTVSDVITNQLLVYTGLVGTLELGLFAHITVELIRAVTTVRVSVTLPLERNTNSVTALQPSSTGCVLSTVQFIRLVQTVGVSVTDEVRAYTVTIPLTTTGPHWGVTIR